MRAVIIGNLDFLSVGIVLLGFYAILQINNQPKIRLDVQCISNVVFIFVDEICIQYFCTQICSEKLLDGGV